MDGRTAAVVWGAMAVAAAAVSGGAFYPAHRVVVGLALAVLVFGFGFARRSPLLTSEEWALAGLVVWGAVSAMVVGNSPLASRLVVTGWLVAWVVWVTSRRASAAARRIASSTMVTAAVLLAAGVALEAVGRGAIRVGGLLENPNVAAAVMVGAMPLVVKLRAETGNRWFWAGAAVLALGISLTGSRAGLLAMLAGGAVLLPGGRVRRWCLAIASGAVAALMTWRFVSQPDVLAWFRPTIWLATLKLWWTRPLTGVGPGGLVDAAGTVRVLHEGHIGHRQFLISYAESSPLGLLVQTGLVGAALAAAVLFLWLRRVHVSGVLSDPAFRSAVVSLTTMAVFHDMVELGIVLWSWALVLGLLESERFREAARRHLQIEMRVLYGMSLAFLVLWGMVGPAWARWIWWNAPRDVDQVERVQAAERWFSAPLEWRVRQILDEAQWTWPLAAEAIARSRRAVTIHPGNSSMWMSVGHVHFRVVSDLGGWPDSIREARRAFVRAAELEPFLPWPWLEGARLERVLGDLDRAASLCERAVEVEPHAVRAWLLLARIELDRGHPERARSALKQATQSARLARQPGLSRYERELLDAPAWQFLELRKALP